MRIAGTVLNSSSPGRIYGLRKMEDVLQLQEFTVGPATNNHADPNQGTRVHRVDNGPKDFFQF